MEERERLFTVLQQFDFLEPYPSQANFILCSVRATAISNGLSGSTLQCSSFVMQASLPLFQRQLAVFPSRCLASARRRSSRMHWQRKASWCVAVLSCLR